MSDPKPRRKSANLPKGVREGAIADIASSTLDKQHTIEAVSKRWGLEPTTVQKLMRSHNEIADLRQAAAGRMMELNLKSQDRLMESLSNDAEMANTSAKDKAFITKATADAAVTLIEGIPQTANIIDFGALKRIKLDVANYRAAKVIEA